VRTIELVDEDALAAVARSYGDDIWLFYPEFFGAASLLVYVEVFYFDATFVVFSSRFFVFVKQ